jgi:inosine-uridine nucleoside N-ribohydrolase
MLRKQPLNCCSKFQIIYPMAQSALRFFIVCLFFAVWLAPGLVAAQNPVAKKPVQLIFDTDMGPDYDDVGALAMLHAFADSGNCTILATMASNKHARIAAVLNCLNTYFNRPEIPIGVVSGVAVDMGAPQKWDSLLVARYPHQINANAEVPDALELYRKVLASAADQSVTIVTVGFFTNLRNLLMSGADKYSPLIGKALVEKKVIRLISMAGRFDQEMGQFKEFNVVKDAASAKYTFDNWPTPIVFSGFEIGVAIHTGLPITKTVMVNSPVKDVFAHCIPLDASDSDGRMSWDETAVLVAVQPLERYFDTVSGAIIGNANGTNNWDKKGSKDKYLVQKMPVLEVEKILNTLIAHQPVKRQ